MRRSVRHLSAVLIALPLLLVSSGARAASFVFAAPGAEVGVGRPFELVVSLNPGPDEVNAVAGELTWPDGLLEAGSVQDGGSLVSLWVEAPQISGNRLVFSGIMPGGLNGAGGRLFTVTFRPKAAGSGTVVLERPVALLNDGQGTPAAIEESRWPFVSSANPAASSSAAPAVDTVPPEEFEPAVSSAPQVFGGAFFLAFVAQDKGSGIDRYEVQETRGDAADSAGWKPAQSPYLLTDQSRQSYIRVRAIDRAGNERIAVIGPRAAETAWYGGILVWCIIGALSITILLFLVWRVSVHRSRRSAV